MQPFFCRGIIPPIGGTLDLSPILAFVLLNFATSTATALPAEVGPDGKMLRATKQHVGPVGWMQSKYEQLWARRVQFQKQRRAAHAAASHSAAARQ